MPSKTSKKKPAATLPHIPADVLDQLVSGPMTAEAINAASIAFKKALIERALGAELSHHLGYPPGTDKPAGNANHRNGVSGKTVLTDDGPLRIDVPRDRAGSFEPVLIPKHERRFTGFDDKIPSAPVQISPGIAHSPSRLCLSDLRHGVPCKFRALQIMACSPHRAASYPLPVRQASALPSASSRFPVAQNTLAVQLTLSLAGQIEDFHLQVSGPAGRTTTKKPLET